VLNPNDPYADPYATSGTYQAPSNPYPTTSPNTDPNAPNTLAMKAASSSGTGGTKDTSAGDWAQWLSFINQVANSRKKPSWQQAPWAPGQQELFNYALNRVKGLPDMSGAMGKYAMTRATENNPIDVAAMRAGKVGYTPTGGANKADLPSMIAAMGGGGGSNTTPTGLPPPGGTSNGVGPTGVDGDPFGHVTSPAGTSGDPFAGMGTTAGGNTDLHSIFQRGVDYINQHGGSGKAVGLTGSAIAAYLGVPGLLATGAGKILSWLWDRYIGGDTAVANAGNGQTSAASRTYQPKPNGTDPWNSVDANGNIVGTSNHRTPVQTPDNTTFDPMGFGNQSTFNNNLANDPGQSGSDATGGMTGFGYGMDYDDSLRPTLPGRPRYGGGGFGGGLV
jgi:hypothetical protein